MVPLKSLIGYGCQTILFMDASNVSAVTSSHCTQRTQEWIQAVFDKFKHRDIYTQWTHNGIKGIVVN